jgi:hypothetical protein
MAKLISKLILVALTLTISSCSAKEAIESPQTQIEFDNSLKQCISVHSHSIKQVENTRLLKINYNTKQSIGYCGCKSALAQYRTFTPHQELSAGLIDFREKKSLNLTLSNTDILLTEAPVTVSFSCSQPL